mmetsp:Transcript_11696/g.25665  ORF Transcript_11696/g.25665 Transcript_11696/m.25665 type:complete len:99 (+) Transcript_11696:1776-2072(+)
MSHEAVAATSLQLPSRDSSNIKYNLHPEQRPQVFVDDRTRGNIKTTLQTRFCSSLAPFLTPLKITANKLAASHTQQDQNLCTKNLPYNKDEKFLPKFD